MQEKKTNLQELRLATYGVLKAEYDSRSYPLTMVDTAINTAIQEIIDGTLYNQKTGERISKLNLRFAEDNSLFETTPVSYLEEDAIVWGNYLVVSDPIQYNPSTGEHAWMQNQFNTVPYLIGESSIWLTPFNGMIAQSFIAERNSLKYAKFYKNVNGTGSGTGAPSQVTFSLRKSVNGQPDSEIITQYVFSWAEWTALPVGSEFTTLLEAELDRGQTYWLVMSIDTTLSSTYLDYPSILGTNSLLRPAFYNQRYKFEGFKEKKPLFALTHNGTWWVNISSSYTASALLETDYLNFIWIDGNVIEYIDFNDVSGIDYPHIAGRPIRYIYEMPSYCNYVVKANYNYNQPLDPVDYRKIQDSNPYNATLNYSTFSDPLGYYGWYIKPCYSIFRENKVIVFHQNLRWPLRIEFQKKALQLYSPFDETDIPTYYALKTIPYIAAAEILQQRGEDDRAMLESDKGYKAVVSLYAREGYKTNEMQFNRRVKTISDSFLNI